MYSKNFQVDFVRRTQKILSDLQKHTEHEVTLLLNCLYGLMIYPLEFMSTNKPQSLHNFQAIIQKELKDYVERSEPPIGKKNPKPYSSCLRNAIAHGDFIIEKDTKDSSEIEQIIFEDRTPGKDSDGTPHPPHCIIHIPVTKLQNFAQTVANEYLRIISPPDAVQDN